MPSRWDTLPVISASTALLRGVQGRRNHHCRCSSWPTQVGVRILPRQPKSDTRSEVPRCQHLRCTGNDCQPSLNSSPARTEENREAPATAARCRTGVHQIPASRPPTFRRREPAVKPGILPQQRRKPTRRSSSSTSLPPVCNFHEYPQINAPLTALGCRAIPSSSSVTNMDEVKCADHYRPAPKAETKAARSRQRAGRSSGFSVTPQFLERKANKSTA